MVSVAIETICDMVDHCRLRLDDVPPATIAPATNLELIKQAALDADDSDQLWSDSELRHYANQAIAEVAIRTRCIRDGGKDTASLTSYAVEADQESIIVDQRVLVIKKVFWNGKVITALSEQFEDESSTDWRDETAEEPTSFMLLRSSRQLRLYPVPTLAGTLTIDVYRRPLQAIEKGTPEISQGYLADCLHWMCHLAYLKNDADTYDSRRALEYANLFTLSIGPRPTSLQLELEYHQSGRRRGRMYYF